MTLDEIIANLQQITLNSKTNNYIYTGLDDESLIAILRSIPRETIITNPDDLYGEVTNIKKLHNTIINFASVPYSNIFYWALYSLKDTKAPSLEDLRSIVRFRNILMEHEMGIQFIMFNLDHLKKSEQEMLNYLLYMNTYYFNIVMLLKEDEELRSYQLPNGKMLDRREDYTKLQLIR